MNKDEIFELLWAEQDRAYDLMAEYDAMPHHYGTSTLYQAEAYIIGEIGKKPGITTTELAGILKKTTSACSQIVKKLIDKGLVEQTRNEENRRVYNLNLTDTGRKLHMDHLEFNQKCQRATLENLSEFTEEELMIHVKVQRALNRSYEADVARSREKYGASN